MMMSPMIENAAPYVVVILLGFMACVRMQSRRKFLSRLRQLNEAADLLALHASSMELFLSHRDAPVELKRLLLSFSDAVADREVAFRMSEWLATRPFRSAAKNEEAEKIDKLLSDLGQSNPEMRDNFARAIGSAAVGSMLRWPESTKMLQRIGARLAIDPRREVTLAVTVSHLRERNLFTAKDMTPAMAA